MGYYRKKPVTIKAIRIPLDDFDITSAFQDELEKIMEGNDYFNTDDNILVIHTLEGFMNAHPGDWIIRGVKGECYPCKDDIFRETYEAV